MKWLPVLQYWSFSVITKVIIENSARWLVAHEVIITR